MRAKTINRRMVGFTRETGDRKPQTENGEENCYEARDRSSLTSQSLVFRPIDIPELH